jgi:hypothetical protein
LVRRAFCGTLDLKMGCLCCAILDRQTQENKGFVAVAYTILYTRVLLSFSLRVLRTRRPSQQGAADARAPGAAPCLNRPGVNGPGGAAAVLELTGLPGPQARECQCLATWNRCPSGKPDADQSFLDIIARNKGMESFGGEWGRARSECVEVESLLLKLDSCVTVLFFLVRICLPG